MRRLFLQTFFLALLVSAPLLTTVAHAAVTCPNQADWTVVGGVCVPTTGSTGLSSTGVSDLLINFMNWLLGIFGTLAIIAFVISGVQYLTAAGDDDTISAAKRNVKYSIIGILVALSGLVILTAISTFLGGASTTF